MPLGDGLTVRLVGRAEPYDYLGVYDSSGALLATSGNFFSPYVQDIRAITARCGRWFLGYDPDWYPISGTVLFNEGDAYVYDRVNSELLIHSFVCEPKPNVCGPFINPIIVVNDGDSVPINPGSEFLFSKARKLRALKFPKVVNFENVFL